MKQTIIEILTEKITNFVILQGSEQRSVADLIEFRVKSILMKLSDNDLVSKCLEPRSKKSIEDMSIVGKDGIKYYTDTKSHNINSDFSMPNLTSVEKLRKLLKKNNEELIAVRNPKELDTKNDYHVRLAEGQADVQFADVQISLKKP